jgi:hypothetical protein
MFIRYITKYIRRSAVTNALFTLLLALSGALLALSAGLWYSVDKSERELEDIITTIAAPDVMAIRRYARTYAERNQIREMETVWGTVSLRQGRDHFHSQVAWHVQFDIFNQITERVYRSGVFDMDDRRLYGAYVEGLHSVPYRITEHGGTDMYVAQAPQSVVAFVATCTQVEEQYSWHESSLYRYVTAQFNVDEEIYLHRGRNRTRTVSAIFHVSNPDGGFPVEEGKQYVLVGFQYFQGASRWGRQNNSFQVWTFGESSIEKVGTVESWGGIENDGYLVPWLVQQGVTSESFPIDVVAAVPAWHEDISHYGITWFELENGLGLDEVLASEKGIVVQTMLDFAKINHNSLLVLTTNDLNSLPRFNQRTARITDGRSFTNREISAGARVCIISSQLAEINDLKIGDILELQMFPNALTQMMMGNESAWVATPYYYPMALTEPLAYRIVGIYTGLTQEMNDYAVSPNTVFIPAVSFEGLDGEPMNAWQHYEAPLLHTIIVPNGRISETKVLIAETAEGYDMFFRFYDQGYSALKAVLVNLRISMVWVLALSAAAWVVAAVMFSLFYIGRKRQEAALLYAVGVGRKRRIRWVFIQCAVVIVLAQGIIAGAALPLYGNIVDAAVDAAEAFTDTYRDYTLSEMNEAGGMQLRLPIDKTPAGLVTAAAGQLALLIMTAGALSARVARQRPLGTEKGAD